MALAISSFSFLSEKSSVLADIRLLLSKVGNASVSATHWQGNVAAHDLARVGFDSESNRAWLYTTPNCFSNCIVEDLSFI